MNRHILVTWLSTAAAVWALGTACSAGNDNPDDDGSGNNPNTSSGTSDGGAGGDGPASSSSDGSGGGFNPVSNGGAGGAGGIFTDPCDSQCEDDELCEAVQVALDNDCDGTVDEGCPCSAGAIQSCFKGDPSYLDDPGCFPGSQQCNELGQWGPCTGGVHATEMCFQQGQGCHPISTAPFVGIDLQTGTGNFSSDAISETFTVACPPGVTPCPVPQGTNYIPLQSGEYTVTYDKTTANGTDQCTFPLFVGAPGLRVELTWDWVPNQQTVDLDLHVHQPQNSQPWGGNAGNAQDCAFNNCTAFAFSFPSTNTPSWFNGVAPPDPVNWYLDPVMEQNTCYYGPKGNGADWQAIGMGCHNPRLDIDNISCDPTVTDSQNFNFCNPENINIDFPPKDQWTRIGVHYYSGSVNYNVQPVVKVFCNGKLAAELGPGGFYDPSQPVVFPPADASDRFWLVADVLFRDDECDDEQCIVEPLYLDPVARTPVLTTVPIVQQTVGPPYPPIPQ